jgi:drug/metabolite transporter (DMT)-like permease
MLLFFILPMGPGEISNSQWGWLFVIGAVYTDGVYILLYGALPKLSTPIIAVLLFVYPASAILVDALVYQTTMSMAQTLGLALIFISSLGVTLRWGVKRPIVAT